MIIPILVACAVSAYSGGLVGGIPYDVVMMHGLLLYLQSVADLWPTPVLGLGCLIGLCLASLERFCIGRFFHLPRFERKHEEYHQILRMRKVTGNFSSKDHLTESVTYAMLFVVLSIAMIPLERQWKEGIWLGLLLEHAIGQQLRLVVQLPYRYLPEFLHAFHQNIEAYYWHHVLIDSHACCGFSSPFWDSCFGSNPFPQRFRWSTPLPFVDFFFIRYDWEPIREQLASFRVDPDAFKTRMLEKIDPAVDI